MHNQPRGLKRVEYTAPLKGRWFLRGMRRSVLQSIEIRVNSFGHCADLTVGDGRRPSRNRRTK